MCFGIILVYGAWLTWDEYRFESLTPGIGDPQWRHTGWLPLLSLLVVARGGTHPSHLAGSGRSDRHGPVPRFRGDAARSGADRRGARSCGRHRDLDGGRNIIAIPTNVYTGIAKYPLIAIPMFVLVGSVFDRTGVALRLVRFATALVGAGRGALATVAVLVAMVIGGISGSGPATSAAVGHVVTRSMIKDGYPRPFIARGRGSGCHRHTHLAVDCVHHLCRDVPSVSVPAIFAAGMFPGILAGLMMLIPIVAISIIKDFGGKSKNGERTGGLADFKEAFWGLLAPVVILGGMRVGAFTPTEAAVMAVFYGLFIGFFIYRSLTLRDVYEMLVEAGELSALILIVVALASVFAWATKTLGVVQPIATSIVGLGLGEYGTSRC